MSDKKDSKGLSVPQALNLLKSKLKETLSNLEQKCLELRKNEQAEEILTNAEQLMNLAKGEDYIDKRNENDPKKRLKNFGNPGAVLPSDKMPKKDQDVPGSGGAVSKNTLKAEIPGAPKAPKAAMVKEELSKVTPPGREEQVKELKGKVKNPWAVAWSSYNKSKEKHAQKTKKNALMGYPPGTDNMFMSEKAEKAELEKAALPGAGAAKAPAAPSGPKVGESLSLSPIASSPVKPSAGLSAGGPKPMGGGKPVQTMVERVASRMPSGGGVKLPGAGLFGKK